MNIMNMAGFTAEASLHKSSGHYRMAGTPNDLVGSRGVLPQLPIDLCLADCDFTYHDNPFGRDFCRNVCQNMGGGGGGGPSEPPEPRCGPCIRGQQRCVIPGVGSYSAPC